MIADKYGYLKEQYTLELMAIIALGYPDYEEMEVRSQNPLSDLAYLNKYGPPYQTLSDDPKYFK